MEPNEHHTSSCVPLFDSSCPIGCSLHDLGRSVSSQASGAFWGRMRKAGPMCAFDRGAAPEVVGVDILFESWLLQWKALGAVPVA